METHFEKAESENYYGMTNLIIICALFLIRSGILPNVHESNKIVAFGKIHLPLHFSTKFQQQGVF